MKLAFGILCATEAPEVVGQLVDSLGDEDAILLHHDASKQPDFALPGRRAWVIPDYVETAWGSPGLPQAIFHLLRTALEREHFDYFQLLSGTCLPLRPVTELKRYLAARDAPIHADIVNLDQDARVLMSHGHRVFCRDQTLASRLLGRSRRWYLGEDPVTIQEGNLGIHERSHADSHLTALQWLGRTVHAAARVGLLDSHPFHGDTAPFVGSLWFCLRRDACEYLVAQEHANPFVPYFYGLKVCDEILFPTLLGNSGFAVAPSNHLVNEFVGAHPRSFDQRDRHLLATSDRYFARKFGARADDPMREATLARLDSRTRERRAPQAAGAVAPA
jgi:hypothetical protein